MVSNGPGGRRGALNSGIFPGGRKQFPRGGAGVNCSNLRPGGAIHSSFKRRGLHETRAGSILPQPAMKHASISPLRHPSRRGFTLVEIMIVVIIIGMVAMLAFPTIMIARSNARSARFINDLRQARSIFETYALMNGVYPADGTPGVVPAGMEDDVKAVHWTEPTAIGGQWDWDFLQYGATAGVSVYLPELTEEQMVKIDSRIDDGDLSTGVFRQRSAGYIYVIE